MKQDIHPAYGEVAFRDRSTGSIIITRSTLVSGDHDTIEVDGATYPVINVDVSSESHPFWTGQSRVTDSEGRVEAFRRRYGGAS